MLEILFCALLFLLSIAPWNHCLSVQRFFSLFIHVYRVLQRWFNHSCMDGYLISFQYFLNLQECCCANLVYMYFFLRCVSSGYIRRCRTAESKHKYILFHAANSPPRDIPVCILSSDTRVPISHSFDNMHCFPFPIFANLIGEKWYLIVVLINSLIIMNVP